MLRTLFSATILAGALAGSAMAQAPDAGCVLPSEPKGIPAAIDAAITGPADKDRACMKALLIPEARMMFVSLGADGAPTYTLQTLDDWIARVKARGHAMLEEKQLKFHIERYGNIAHLWSSYALYSDGKQVARGINSIQAIKEAGGWRVAGIMVLAEDLATGSSTGPLAAYMIRHKLVSGQAGTRFISEQGTKMGRRSLLHVEVQAEDDGIYIGGHVTPVAEAVMTLASFEGELCRAE